MPRTSFATFVLLGGLGALGMFGVDTVRLVLARGFSLLDPFQWSYQLSLMALVGCCIGLAQWLSLRLVGAVCGLATRDGRPVIGIPWQVGLLGSPMSIFVARAMFEGRAVSQLPVASWGPWVVSVVLIGGFVLFTSVWLRMRRACQGEGRTALKVMVPTALLGAFVALALMDLYLYTRLYLYLHYFMCFLAFTLLQLVGFWLVGARLNGIRSAAKAAPVVVVVAYCVVFHGAFEFSNQDKFPRHFKFTNRVVLLVRTATDFDADGYSSLLAHGDRDNWNSAVHPMARETPGNGIDEDCVFGDLDPADLAVAAKRYETRTGADRSVIEHTIVGKPHVILVSIDALRYDRTSNAADPASPSHTLQGLLESSVVFERAYSGCSYTERSLRIALKARYKDSHDTPTIFEHLKDAGYRTALCTSLTHVGIIKREEDLTRGFDTIRVAPDGTDEAQLVPFGASLLTADKVVDDALGVIGAHAGGPLCLWVHLFDLHQWSVIEGDPRVTDVGKPGVSDFEVYDSFTRFCAEQVARLLTELDRRPEFKNSIVVLTSDHGEGLGFKGYRRHTQLVHRPLLHVPLTFRIPGAAPRSIMRSVGLVDLAPTLATLCGVAPWADPQSHGSSLVPLMADPTTDHHPIVVYEDRYHALITEAHKFVVRILEGSYALYDVENDPGEWSNLFMADSHKELSRRMYLLYQACPISPQQMR